MHILHYLINGVLLLALLAPVSSLAADDQISFTSVAEIETEVFDENGKKELIRSPARLLQPGEIAIYTNAFTNNGTEPADGLTIKNPVPENTEYLRGSATETGADLTFSIDGGKSYARPDELMLPDGKGGMRQAEPKEYTDIRWQMQESLAPGATGIVEFRVRVK